MSTSRAPAGLAGFSLSLLALLATSGCRGCKNDHPYTPPEPDAAAPSASAPLTAVTSESARPDGGRAEPAFVAPVGARRWEIQGLVLEAGGSELVQALLGDFDGDGQRDALALVRPADHKGSSGALLFFAGAGGKTAPPAVLATGPAMGSGPSCTPVARLERLGARAAFAEIGSACARTAGARGLVVVRLAAPMPRVTFEATVADPPDAPKLDVDVDVVDRDRDGQDDVVVHAALEGEGTLPRLAANLAFFDRPAGPSRDPEEPEASLKAFAAQAVARAKTKDAKTVPPLVEAMRALGRALCLEGGAPRLTSVGGGGPVACGASKALEDAGVAAVRAQISLKDPVRVFSAAEQAQLPPATKTAAKSGEIAKMLAELAPPVDGKVRLVAAIPDAVHDTRPEWGPLAFEPGGKLLVRGGGKVVRVDPESGDEEATELPPWKDDVVSPDGKLRWAEAYHACAGAPLHATLAADADTLDVPLPVEPRLGKGCAGRGGDAKGGEARGEPATAAPVSWTARGLEALVGGELVLIKADPPGATPLSALLEDPPPPGSPRSQGGHGFALAERTGVLVRRADRWTLVRSGLLEPYPDLKRCVADDAGAHVACIRHRKAVLVTLP